MAWCAPSRGRPRADDSSRVQVFHYEPESSDSYSDSSDYVEQNARSASLLSRVFKPKKKWQAAAVQVYKRHQGDNLYIHKVRLQSPQLKEALKELLERHGLVYRDDSVMVESLAPHRALYFVRHHVAELAKMSDNDMTRAHCSLLSDIIQEIFRDRFDEIETLNREEKITFNLLWTLFPEGGIFGTHLADEVTRAYKVNSVTLDKEKVGIKCETIMFSGYCFRRYLWNFNIFKFDGKIKRLEIPFMPYIDLECNRALRDRLIERGKKALDFQVPRYMEYDPEACREDASVSPWVAKGTGKIPGKQKVVIDFFLVRKRSKYAVAWEPILGYNVGTRMGARHFRRPTSEEVANNNRVILQSEDNLLIMSPYVSGFSLCKRTYADFEIDALKTVERDRSAMEKIIFDDAKKGIVKALVDGHKPMINHEDGRKRPLIISISGASGTGKTLMAESVAAFAGLPLLKDWLNLRDTFEEARDWGGCIFVRKEWGPSPSQLNITAFAKELDNFNGIVIVCSVHQAPFPPMIASRAQISISMRTPTMSERKRLWETFNYQLPSDVGKLSPDELVKLSIHPMTGRDIRNTLDISVTWSRSLGQSISFETVEMLRKEAFPQTLISRSPGMPPPPPPSSGMSWPPTGMGMPPGMAGRARIPMPGPAGAILCTAPPVKSKKKTRQIVVSDDDHDDVVDDSKSTRIVTTISTDDDDSSEESDTDTSRD
ncbi:hypothetical protein QBC41DRAFT_284069 [Cercophora samala]|uniref:DUF7025 domain-containing protein n=1 Tax=Cercophora samala TaxID=330535 RepID=A0AA39Z4N1_9PEZI|nr:hypothetical protein QBC41DRAFT_284069 [Cercophora samala]